MKDKNKLKDIQRIITDSMIIISKKGMLVEGTAPELMTMYTLLTKHLKKQLGDDVVKETHRIANMTEKELEKETLERMKDMMNKIKSISEEE